MAHIERVITGNLKIKTTNTDADSMVTKPFTDRAAKNLIFRRMDRDARKFWNNWKPVASSLVRGGTDPAPAGYEIQVSQVEIIGPGDTLTITDPENFWLRYRWLRLFHGGLGDVPDFRGGDSIYIRATIKSQASDTDMVALRHGFGSGHFKRALMTLVSETGPDGAGFYTRVYERKLLPRIGFGSYHIGVDAISRATLYESTAPYSASWWGVPYRMF